TNVGGDCSPGQAGGYSVADSDGSGNPGSDCRWSRRSGPQPRPDQRLRPGPGPGEDRCGVLPPTAHPGWRGKTRPAAGNARQVASRGDAVRLTPVRATAVRARLSGGSLPSG